MLLDHLIHSLGPKTCYKSNVLSGQIRIPLVIYIAFIKDHNTARGKLEFSALYHVILFAIINCNKLMNMIAVIQSYAEFHTGFLIMNYGPSTLGKRQINVTGIEGI